MKEFEFIRRYLSAQSYPNQVLLGVGDDAAIIQPTAGHDLHVSSDMLLAGRHFFADVLPQDLAHKVLAVNLSDMAAMGAVPRWFTLSMALPVLDEAWLNAFFADLFAMAAAYGVSLIGGDTVRGDWVFNITIMGETPSGQALRRSGAQAGDDVWVSGEIGSAAAALAHLLGDVRLPENLFAECEHRLLRPTPRVALGQRLLHIASAAQDISDGLAQDLQHLLRASQLGAVIQAAQVPLLPALKQWMVQQKNSTALFERFCLNGGDDYELVFTASPTKRAAVSAAAALSETAVCRIGTLVSKVSEPSLMLENEQKQIIAFQPQGFDHFV
ncbi:thiamine-phosphate kinase [Stenoxybacter acetivorans]|uniref:thiamine-phosphate kinase n=1 Tax=Stenoxybacter acetivorans TaxID=422441 RepID=UPI0005606DD7|nr:thiamine-phosphate kinase [Stenoxybacter acetivorans]